MIAMGLPGEGGHQNTPNCINKSGMLPVSE
jgi:hypothetical protein